MSEQTTATVGAVEDGIEALLGRFHALRDDPTAGRERERLLEQVVRWGLPMARRLAGSYRGRGVPDDDLVQIASLALLKALHAYEPGRGSGFVPYALPTIRGELRRHFRDNGWMVRPPRRLQETALALPGAVHELTQRLGRSPTYREIAAEMGRDEEEVIAAAMAKQGYDSTSLDAPRGEGGLSWGDVVADEGSDMDRVPDRMALRDALRRLPARERRILALRFFAGRTQSEIGAEIGVTQMQVSRLLSRSLADLRTHLGEGSRPCA